MRRLAVIIGSTLTDLHELATVYFTPFGQERSRRSRDVMESCLAAEENPKRL
jgi:hypothetical protein